MPRFNIFKAFTSTVKPNQSKEAKATTSSQLPQNDTTNTRPPARKLTKRRGPGVPPVESIEPSYNVRREDIGYPDLGRYPSQLPEPILVDSSNPPHYADAQHPHFQDRDPDSPTTNIESFRPRSQSSKRWSLVPGVHRESPTEDGSDVMSESSGPHFHAPRDSSRPALSRNMRPTRRGRRSNVASREQTSEISHESGTRSENGTEQGSGEIPSDARLGDTQGMRYVRDNTVHDGALRPGVSMRATPVDLSGKQPSSSQKSYVKGGNVGSSHDLQPVVFEHEILRDDGKPNPKIWHYIVPGGLDVIFKDEDGNELTRVRNPASGSTSRRVTPMVIEDESGNVIHRIGDFHSPADDSRTKPDTSHSQKQYPYESSYRKVTVPGNSDSEPIVRAPAWIKQRSGSPTWHVYTSYLSPEVERVILIDERGRQITIADRRKRSSNRRRHPQVDPGR